jgi:protease-4
MRFTRSIAASLLVLAAGAPMALAATASPAPAPNAPASAPQAEKVKVATIELKGVLADRKAPPNPFGFAGAGRSMREVLAALDTAAGRADLAGVLIQLKDAQINSAQIEELGRAMKRLRDAGKKVHLFSYGYGTGELLLGSFADEVIVQSGGGVSLPGMHMDEMYLADMLAWVGAKPDMVQVGDYKGASETIANSKPSGPWNQNIDQLLDSMYANVRSHLKAGRKMDDAALDKAMDAAWMATADDAKRVGLVDAAVDLAGLAEHLKARYGKDVSWDKSLLGDADKKPDFSNPFAIFAQLMSASAEREPTQPTIAVLHIDGAIVDGNSGGGGLFGGGDSVGSITVRRALSKIEANDMVKGVVVRIDSPGGSAIASEVIWQGLKRVAAKGKPVWVSVGSMAASGGYYIAVAGDRVYVNPSSIVGSIGVVGGKIALGGVYEKLKINVVSRSRGPRAAMNGGAAPWNDEQRGYVRQRMKDIYDLFASRVTAGRTGINLSETAEGRLFTGGKAVELKMADRIGGLQDAVDDLAKDLGLSAGAYEIMDYPAPPGIDEVLGQMFGANAPGVSGVATRLTAAQFDAVGTELLGPAQWRAARRAMAGLFELRREPVLLTSPSVLIVR